MVEHKHTLAVNEQDDVLAKGLVQTAVHGQNLDDLIRQSVRRRRSIHRVMGRDHELFIQNKLYPISLEAPQQNQDQYPPAPG